MEITQMTLGFVFTNYNNSQDTIEAIESIKLSDARGSAIVVVDNCSSPSEVQKLKSIQADNADVVFMFLDQNVGYFPGLNLGIEQIRTSAAGMPMFVIAGNNDLLFPADFKASIMRVADTICLLPVIAPDVVTLDGEHQNPHVKHFVSCFRFFLYDLYYSNFHISNALSIASQVKRWIVSLLPKRYESAQTVDMGIGAVYILSPKFFECFGKLPEDSMLMHEEAFLYLQLKSQNFRTYYEPGIRITHKYHGSTKFVSSRVKWERGRAAYKKYRKLMKNSSL